MLVLLLIIMLILTFTKVEQLFNSKHFKVASITFRVLRMHKPKTNVFLTIQTKQLSEHYIFSVTFLSCLLFPLPSLNAEIEAMNPTSLSVNCSTLKSKIRVSLNFEVLVPITVLGLSTHSRIKSSLFHGSKGCDQ